MKGIFSVQVENRAGVLGKVAGLFARRCFNIDSLAVGETENKDVSVITIVSSGDKRTIEQIEKQLNKKLDIIKVKTFSESNSVCRELMLIKVKYQQNNRSDIIEICNVLNASVLDMSASTLLIQICDSTEKIELLIKMLSPFGIVELARTGTLALQKCSEGEKAK